MRILKFKYYNCLIVYVNIVVWLFLMIYKYFFVVEKLLVNIKLNMKIIRYFFSLLLKLIIIVV